MPYRSRRSSSATACFRSRPAPGERLRQRPVAGFTLLEVLVALSILGLGIGVIFQGLGQGLRLRGQTAENVQLALVAESLLGGLPERASAPAAPEEGEEGDCRWRIETVQGAVTKGAAAAPIAGQDQHGAQVLEVLLTVTAKSGRTWELTTLLPAETTD